jgi:hypothetical protein
MRKQKLDCFVVSLLAMTIKLDTGIRRYDGKGAGMTVKNGDDGKGKVS